MVQLASDFRGLRSIYGTAAGDVTGPPLLAPAGELEGRVAVENMFAGRHCTVDHHGTPMAVFIDPEIAMVGQNATQAAANGAPRIEGRIVRVFDKKAGTGEHGPWSFQNFVVADDSGEMTVCLKNRSEVLTSADVEKLISAKSKETK